MKKLIKQWLCEHKETKGFRRILLTEDDMTDTQSVTLKGQIWCKCISCGKIKTYKWKK